MNRPDSGAKVLFILTHRLGDLLQAFPAFALARRRLPQAQLHLLCDDGCAPLGRLCMDLDRVHVFPRATLLPGSAFGPAHKAETVLALSRELRSQGFTHVVNLMGNHSAAQLGFLASGPETRSFGRSFGPTGIRAVEQRWARLLLALPAARAWQPFHLSEIFARLTAESLGLDPELELPSVTVDRSRGLDLVRPWAPTGDPAGWLSLRRPWVGLQGGASKSIRKPPPAWLRSFGREFLSQVGGTLFLLGTQAELEGFQPFLRTLSPSQKRRVIPACGAVDLAGLADLCAALDGVVSVDTFTLHLAAAVGTPVLGLYPGPASPHEAGPWGSGHLVLWADASGGPCACERGCQGATECWERLHPELAVGALGLLLSKGEMGALTGRRVRAFESVLDRRSYRLRAVDGARERESELEELSTLARAWALRGPRPDGLGASAAQGGFSGFSRALRQGGDTLSEALVLRKEPADWFRAQAIYARGDDGAWNPLALEDTLQGCNYFNSPSPLTASTS
jgi:ADP-heptose:LPS heptosyltransferase